MPEVTSDLAGHDIICVSSTDWDVHWGTQQQVLWRLAETNRVLFLEVPVSPLSPFTGLRKGTWVRQLRRWQQGGLREEKRNLLIASPPPVLPFRYHKMTNRITQNILAGYIENLEDRLGFKNPIVITYQADSAALVKRLSACLKIYFCTDDWAASERWWQPPDKVRAREMDLVDACDLVFATSQRLAQRLKEFGKPSYFLSNAVDYDLFSRAQALFSPEEICRLGKPVIGFAGIIHRHSFDASLIHWLGHRHPDWTFLIVGKKEGREPDLTDLKKLPNVLFTGYKPLDMLPGYLAGMDVCLIPLPTTEWAKGAFSLKLFEYLATGKPVVTTWTEEYVPYENLVRQARTYEEFEQCVEKALGENCEELARKRMELARDNSWENRITRFSQVINDYLAEKHASA